VRKVAAKRKNEGLIVKAGEFPGTTIPPRIPPFPSSDPELSKPVPLLHKSVVHDLEII